MLQKSPTFAAVTKNDTEIWHKMKNCHPFSDWERKTEKPDHESNEESA